MLPTFKADNDSPRVFFNTVRCSILYKVMASLPCWHTPKDLLALWCPSVLLVQLYLHTGIPQVHSFQGAQLTGNDWAAGGTSD